MIELSERRKSILKAVVEEYILQGQPVGSEAVLRKYGMPYSPATIRGDMFALEEMGYLTHPHTSAGRIPTELGYRHYIDHLLTISPVPEQETEKISQALLRTAKDLHNTLAEACRLVSAISTYTSLALTPQLSQQVFRHLHFIPVSSRRALLILVSNLKIIQDAFVEILPDLVEEDLEELSRILTRALAGKTAWQSLQTLRKMKEHQPATYLSVWNQVASIIHDAFLYEQGERLIVESAENILLTSDLHQSQLRIIAGALDRRFLLQEMLERHLTSKNLQVFIGQENEVSEMRELSLLSMPFEVSTYALGALGLVGPVRMDYAKAIRLLSCVTGILEKTLQAEEV
jgi:heat-inducible transcriptional repressor